MTNVNVFTTTPSTTPRRRWLRAAATLSLLPALATILAGCGSTSNSGGTTTPPPPPPYVIPVMKPTFSLTGDVTPVHDPSLSYDNGTYYSMSTDPGGTTSNFLPIRSSTDKLHWVSAGAVFPTMPAVITNYFAPTVLTSLWAPDVSFFNGLYHLYYVGSDFGTNTSIIALATNPTLDPTDPTYLWTNQGKVISSNSNNPYNTIDPSILVDTDSSGNLTHVWMSFGSYFGGIYEAEIDPTTGLLLNTPITNIATRPGVQNNPIEGTSLVKHNGYYYLFASFDYCCQSSPSQDNYKIAVGRSSSAQGPFADMTGTAMLQGGGTILMESGTQWTAPGGATVLIDPTHGDLIAYHALDSSDGYLDYLFVDSLTWPSDWPVITQ
jgi:arabinan endo-1,5-alpha-L-arabinosidase